MNNDIVSRIKEFMEYKSLNSLTLSNKLGYKSSEKLSRLFRGGNAKPSYEIIYDISNMFEINVDWLITGRGSMLLSDGVPTVSANPSTAAPEQSDTVILRFMDKLDEKDNLLKEKEAKIDQLQSELRIKSEELAVFKAKYPQNEPQLEASKDAVKGLGPVKNASTKKPSSPNADNATSANVR